MFLKDFLPKKSAKKVIIANPDKPYKLCRLVDYSGNLNRDWYIEFSIWNENTEEIERKRLSKNLNKLPTEKARRDQADIYMTELDALLKKGKVIKKVKVVPPAPKFKIKEATLIATVERHIANNKTSLSPATIKDYGTLKNTLVEWLKLRNLEGLLLLDFSVQLSNEFFLYLKNEKKQPKKNNEAEAKIGVANKTYNNYHTNLAAVFNALKNEELIKKKQNPLRKISKKKTKAGNHIPFTKEQMVKIEKLIIKKQEFQLLLFIKMVYYTFARPGKEIRLLQIKDIRETTIFIPNNRSKTEGRHVSIPDDLEKIFQKNKYRNYPPNYYLFSLSGQPGPKPVNKDFFYNRHVKILEELNFTDQEYTLYGYKHTGNIYYYLATLDIKAVQEQNGHTTSKQTEEYLKNLGLLRDEIQIKKFPSFSEIQKEKTLE
jgi:integrase